MSSSQTLKNKHAVVFGAGGSIGAAVASEFAAEGAEVFLSGRTQSNLEAVANQIGEQGGLAQTAVIDTLNDPAVNEYFEGIVKQKGQDRHHPRCHRPSRQRVRKRQERRGFTG